MEPSVRNCHSVTPGTSSAVQHFARELARAGLRMSVTGSPAVNERGEPVPDLRVFAQERDDDPRPRLLLSNPASIWGRAGLHTGDLIASFNGVPIRASADFRRPKSRRSESLVLLFIDWAPRNEFPPRR